ncbi:helix-turn-helix transcriptional regulator [Kitasatospora sp. NBC_01287]|uniref:helix-turn-helix transcriptional regulator n=1 Tax=Kitasatospora sp. NBC_01287 TaxID=2903573 RepID=UPI0022598D43|nr:helix-turn-helix transcriptional regulator [Kitasatospora sp. NBC_01287]MCX4744911.1 helix-turn-helix transcriptional regulator [Kitasatospora sp. NBC_01287]
MDRQELADFLSRRRARLTPADVGLPPGARRRTPGLRREEVAGLAGLSVDYYARLEQARGPQPSPALLAALARALRLSGDERDHLFHLAGHEPPRGAGRLTHVRPGLLLILDRLYDTPAQVVSELGDILAQNALSAALSGDMTQVPPRERNLVWRWFAVPGSRSLFLPADHEQLARAHVAGLRVLHAARSDDPEVRELVESLLATSEEFRELWARHDVAVRRAECKTFLHPQVGAIELDCEVLAGAGEGQRLVVFTARPGSESAGRLELLRVIGQQRMTEARG